MRVWCVALLLLGSPMEAHEFIQRTKLKHISVQSIKEEAGQIFAQHLRESAQIVQLLGRAQLNESAWPDVVNMGTRLHEIAWQLRTYSDLLGNPLCPPSCAIYSASQSIINVNRMLAEITHMIGNIQQHLIKQLNDLLDDTGNLFVKKHAPVLQLMLVSIKSYSGSFQDLHKLLSGIGQHKQCHDLAHDSNKKEFSKK